MKLFEDCHFINNKKKLYITNTAEVLPYLVFYEVAGSLEKS